MEPKPPRLTEVEDEAPVLAAARPIELELTELMPETEPTEERLMVLALAPGWLRYVPEAARAAPSLPTTIGPPPGDQK